MVDLVVEKPSDDIDRPKFQFGDTVKFKVCAIKNNGAGYFYDGVRAKVFACRWVSPRRGFEYRLIFSESFRKIEGLLPEELLFIAKETLWAGEHILEACDAEISRQDRQRYAW